MKNVLSAYREGRILRSYVIDFLDWQRARMRRRPWLLFKSHDYWRHQFAAYIEGRIERDATDKLFDAVKEGKTTFTDLAKIREAL